MLGTVAAAAAGDGDVILATAQGVSRLWKRFAGSFLPVFSTPDSV